jgi:serine/threonine-protein kinase
VRDRSEQGVTGLLLAWAGGDQTALAALLPRVYDELRSLASSYLRREPPGHTLETGALVHEAYLRLVDQERVEWRSRSHFFGIAAQMMRRILVDHARSHLYAKRGGGARRRQAFAEQTLGGDAEALREVLSLLRADARARGFLELPLVEPAAGGAAEAQGAAWIGKRIGPYRLVGKLGEGGMSTVYLAEREDEQYRRQVAIKVVRSAFAGEDQLRRFRAERQILASLDHPGIARLYDGGATEEGLPYLVMEYIEGEPIDDFCDRRRLTIAQRIELFRAVCSAVHYAHQNLVVHRDLKPGNILVTTAGLPRLLDFGIAKLLTPELLPAGPVTTVAWLRLMTPYYASPEQILGKPVTTGSDVYSLGLLLYKLLTGRLPRRFAGQAPAAIERVVTEEEPEKPSAAVGRGGRDGPEGPPTPEAGQLEAVARARGVRPAQLRRLLAGDLDTVVLSALRRDPQRRYGSAEQLSEDLRRHLEGLPVLAHPDSLPYRAGKFLRRHRLAVGAAAAILLLAVGAAVAFALQSARLARERDRAERERVKAQRVAEFLEEVFSLSHRADPRIEPMTALEVLERGARKLDQMGDQPQIQAALMHTMGRIYRDLGRFEQAAPLLERALAARTKLPEAEPAEVLENMEDLGVLLVVGIEEVAHRAGGSFAPP